MSNVLDIQGIEAATETAVSPVLAQLGYDLIAAEFTSEGGRWILRLSIDQEGGISVGDCERVSHAVEDLIVVEVDIPVSYHLEVSSPGVFRPLKRRADYERYIGERIRLKTHHPIEGRSNFKGVLLELAQDDLVMLIDAERYTVPLSAVRRGRLEPEEVMPVKQKKKH